MTEEELIEEYWREINDFHEKGATMDDLINLLVQVYRGGYYDGLSDGEG